MQTDKSKKTSGKAVQKLKSVSFALRTGWSVVFRLWGDEIYPQELDPQRFALYWGKHLQAVNLPLAFVEIFDKPYC